MTMKSDSYLTEKDKVCVFLSYYNGKKFIADQIESIRWQSYKNLEIIITDDRSDQHQLEYLDTIIAEIDCPIVVKLREKNVGYARNFLDAVSSVDNDCAYYAFSDQDDIWKPEKLQRAVSVLSKLPQCEPALYCSRTEIISEDGHSMGTSPVFSKKPSFANALVQSIGGGNTMVFNKSAKQLIVQASLDVDVISHDWWVYQIVSGAGGHVYYDASAYLKYRQHQSNLMGANNSWTARFIRLKLLFEGRFRMWNDVQLKALSAKAHLLSEDNQKRLEFFKAAREQSVIYRILGCKRSGIHRQTMLDNIGLMVGVLLNKI